MENNIIIEAPADSKLKKLQAILYLLQTNLEEFKDEVDKSYELLKVGKKTDFLMKIEKQLDDPVDNIFRMSSSIDEKVKYILDKFVKGFLKSNKEIVHSSFRSRTCLNDLHYSIILKQDNIENRNKIFDFLDNFDVDIASKYPVYFQFVPIELISKINSTEEIILDTE